MAEDKYDLQSSATASLARLFELSSDPGDTLGEEDLAAVLQHQLDAPLLVDLKDEVPDIKAVLGRMAIGQDGSPVTFRSVLLDRDVPVELLVMVKEFAKRAVQGELDREREIAGVIYLASISAAQLHCGETISSLGEEWQLFNLRRFLQQPWLDGDLCALFASSLEKIESSA